MIVQAALEPLPRAAPPAIAPLTGDALPPLRVATTMAPPKAEAAAASAFRVQAGAFSTPENAQRAVAQLASAGPARVEPMSRGGTTLYRVVLDAAADQDSAEELREKVAEAGFADARVIRPF
jgi:rare lipoprotein A